MRVFAFLDLDHPPVAWAVMRGMIVSADQVSPSRQSAFVSFMLAGMIQHQNNPRIYNEIIIEKVRKRCFRHQTSRIRGIYFFQSREEAEARIDDRHWPPYFKKENLLELELYYGDSPTIVDANWITFAPLDSDNRIKGHDLSWIEKYWRGEEYDDDPVWELITNGVALVLDEDARRRCADAMNERFPESQVTILMARLASEAGTNGGLVNPYLFKLDNSRVRLSYLMSDNEFHEPDVIEKIKAHPDWPTLNRLAHENETWKMPDFEQWGCTYKVGSQGRINLESIEIPSVHHL